MRELWLKIIHTSGAKIYSLLIGVIILLLTARWLGPEGRGTVAAIMTWVTLFSTFGSLSLGPVTFHRATLMRGESSWLANNIGSLLLLVCIATLLSWGTAGYLYFITNGTLFNKICPTLLSVGLLLIPLMLWEQYGNALLMALNQISLSNQVQVKAKTISVIVVIFLLSLHGKEIGILIANFCSQIVIATETFKYLFKQAKKPIRPNFAEIKELLKGSLKIHLASIANFLYMGSDILMINYYRGTEETGYYQIAVQIVGILLIIPNSASAVISGKVAMLGPDQAWPEQRQLLTLLTIGMIVIASLSAMLASWLIPLSFGDTFTPAIPVFQLLLIGVIGMTFSIMMSSQWIGRGLFWQLTAITVTVGILNGIGNLILIPKYGMYGAVFPTLVTYLISIIGNGTMAVWVNRRSKKYVS